MKYIFSVLFSKMLCLGHQPGADLGPVISPQAKERICNLVQSGADEGAKVRETSYSLTLLETSIQFLLTIVMLDQNTGHEKKYNDHQR